MSSQTTNGSRSLRAAAACTLLVAVLASCSTGRDRASTSTTVAALQAATSPGEPGVLTPATESATEEVTPTPSTPQTAKQSPSRPARTPNPPSSSPSSSAAVEASTVDPASVHANELGLVPVLMYHQIVADPGSDRYNQTPAQFKAELQTLFDGGYVPVTAADFVAGTIDIPAGKHPVVLTFDDSTRSQFGLTAAGDVKPGTAVAMLVDFAKSHPGFAPVATMYVNFAPQPFAGTDPSKGLLWLTRHGFEIGNHTLSHANLRAVGPAKAQAEIAQDKAAIEAVLPHYGVTTIALPFGVHPQPASLAWSGSAGGVAYHFAGVMEVGSNPAHSPYSAAFDGTGIPRIRSQSLPGKDAPYESKHWLEWLSQHPDLRYTSDGDPAGISYPRGSKQSIATRFRSRARAY